MHKTSDMPQSLFLIIAARCRLKAFFFFYVVFLSWTHLTVFKLVFLGLGRGLVVILPLLTFN